MLALELREISLLLNNNWQVMPKKSEMMSEMQDEIGYTESVKDVILHLRSRNRPYSIQYLSPMASITAQNTDTQSIVM